MPLLPIIDMTNSNRIMTEEFRGYDHNLKIADGEFYDTLNLSSEHFPLLADRKKRGTVLNFSSGQAILGKDTLCWVDGGTLYVGGLATPVTGLRSGEKQMVSMGAFLCIFPDKVYYNTADPTDYGSMEATYRSNLHGSTVRYQACTSDGEVIGSRTVSASAPSSPTNGAVWVDSTSGSWYEWSSYQEEWIVIATVYTKITFQSMGMIPTRFKSYDGVTLSGTAFPEDLDGEKILYSVGGDSSHADFIVVIGPIEQDYSDSNGAVVIERKVPAMDYVCECRNRLWGCYYGHDGEKNLNEIYCCALGDFRNWRQYMGVSTDSWAASVGSDGAWTGAIAYLGYPTFFKENFIHRVVISAEGAHQLLETECRGVQSGSARSLQIAGETLYYKSRRDVCAWQGGFPAGVSKALGGETYKNASAGVFGSRYYLSMQDKEDNWNLFVYDTETGIWMREDDLHALQFAAVDDELYCLAETDGTRKLLALQGTDGTLEENVPWKAETGILYYEYPDHKYVSRYNIRLRFTGTASISIEYDSSGNWISSGSFTMNGTDSIVIPVRPRRCDHMRVRISGVGEVRIFSITRVLEKGSDQ